MEYCSQYSPRPRGWFRHVRHIVLFFLVTTVVGTTQVHATGGQFGLEFAIDAPWRLEPLRNADGSLSYGPIPITITFNDAVFEVNRDRLRGEAIEPIDIGRLREVTVREWVADQPIPRHPVVTIPAGQMYELERKVLVSTTTREPPRELCRPGPGQDCSPQYEISGTHEWHAAFWYTPQSPVTPGRNIHLEVTVATESTIAGVAIRRKEWKNYLVVHAGEAPLPRFSDQWLYGDLHYHSQMTDNEGESGYSYRNVVRTLGALGVDFVFATDHASGGTQVDGVLDARYCADSVRGKCLEARDLNVHRYAAARSILYGPDGANEAVGRDAVRGRFARSLGAGILPQVYMGEELDAWPEISNDEYQSGLLKFGDGLTYAWANPNGCLERNSLETCKQTYSQRPDGGRDHRSYLVKDEQGIPIQERIRSEFGDSVLGDILSWWAPDGTQPFPSRQHFVYFPFTASPGSQGWIGSNTGPFGGASKRLHALLREVETQGVGFLAHPLTSLRPGGAEGPDIIPYSQRSLDVAWSSPAVLGMEFWNENDRRRSGPTVTSPTVMFVSKESGVDRYSYPWPYQGHEYGNFPWRWQRGVTHPVGNELYHDAFIWDRMLRKGLDLGQTSMLPWLPKGEPRKWLMAGGSDAHGDFNYRRYGTPCLERWCDVPVGDTAIANPRNLVSMLVRHSDQPAGVATEASIAGAPRRADGIRYPNKDVMDALAFGNFSVTDGPALRIAVDRNNNGVIDEGDFQMGTTVNFYPADYVPLLVEWISSPEFGPVSRIDLYVGNPRQTFAPKRHGPVIPGGQGRNTEYGNYAPDPSGALQAVLADQYGNFSLAGIPLERGYHGVMKVYLGPNQFGMVNAGDGALSYVRAFARTVTAQQGDDLDYCGPIGAAGSMCGDRYAYTNPIWMRFRTECPVRRGPMHAVTAIGRSYGRMFIDGDANGYPDGCQTPVADPCPREASGRPPLLADPESRIPTPPSNSCKEVIAAG